VVVVPFTLLQYLLGDQVRTRGEETANGVVVETASWAVGIAGLVTALAGAVMVEQDGHPPPHQLGQRPVEQQPDPDGVAVSTTDQSTITLWLQSGDTTDLTREAAEWLLSRLPEEEHVLCVSILRDKDADAILEQLASAGSTLIATRSSNERALDEEELARHAEPYFQHVETVADPRQALDRARALGPRVLVTGSLYLLADL
jgi:hypothetical protein